MIPPNQVYTMTPAGKRRQASQVGIPVSELTTAEPPVRSIAVTRIFVKRPKTMNVTCAKVP